MKHPNPFFHLLEELSLLILITPVVFGVLLYEQGIAGFRLVCIAVIGSICVWAVYFTLKILREIPTSVSRPKEKLENKEF
ncbi:MAG: hypothetical protein PUJ68_08060 [[Actinobacillus] rossii]|uniref:Uncharacterized protein n=1 Tax=[Actinobacillus] rossii TaxID=123820 RepID=A0A380TW14_9PAST|nr:hypothetical protein [[Actinobacillus] rossii]MDD7425607.1 hypothetical protein [[Actinobacillus] rossii]MDD7569838.1 hypothetical protein [[Actinobacillus] rossii]MDY3124064.1 hypothetical protein [[Actinobacillus] rossii]MDY4507025.1 hypothetical protein [[Actinobacillus] rossii]